MGERRFLLILTSVIVVLLAVVIWFYPSSKDFGDENPLWNGLKTFSAEFKTSSIDSLDNLPDMPEGTTLMLIPYLEFTQLDLERLENYISHGGTLILLDDYGYGNEIVDYMGLDFRFTQCPLLDPLFNYQNKWYPKITDFAPVSVTENVESIVLNHATSLSGGSEDEVIAWSSQFSFSDLNNNSTWDKEEPRGHIPIAAALPVDKGYLVLVADPSILINSMEGRDDNYSFIENIITIQDSDPEVLIDQSHLPEASLDEVKDWLAIARSHLSSPLGISGLVVVALIVTLSPLWRKK